jgi:CheY-like chemotaxis protein
MMSHEVRTPMNAILGMMELLFHTPLSRDQWNLVDTARSAGESLIGILDSVMDISKVETGTLQLGREPFSLADLVEGLAGEVAPEAADKRLELTCLVDSRLPEVLEGDPSRIRQVLMNLLGNAVKFTRQGSVGLSAHVREEGEDDVWIRIAVEDTGTGIPAHVQDRIFDPFFQVAGGAEAGGRGVGLGLAIAKSFTELMDGRLEVESKAGQGTRFQVSIPLKVSRKRFPKRRISDRHYSDFMAILLSPSVRVREASAEVFSSLMVPFSISREPEDLAHLLEGSDSHQQTVVFVDHRIESSELEWLRHHMNLRSADLDLALAMLVPPGHPEPRNTESSLRVFHVSKPISRRGVAGVFHEVRGGEAHRGPPSRTPVEGPSVLKGLKVLLVEDREENRRYLSRVLRTEGILVDEASDGEIGLLQYENDAYDLVLTDLDMPGMDGFELLDQIRAVELREGATKVPIVAITGHAEPGIPERCFRAGMAAFLTKPVGRREILSVVEDIARVRRPVLVVEDDKRNRELTCEILSRRGFHAEGVGTGGEALERARATGVRAVLLDMTLPDMSGLDVARKMREIPHLGDLPILGVTGRTGSDEEARCKEAGCTGFFEKPVRWDAFFQTLDQLLAGPGDDTFKPLAEGLTEVDDPNPDPDNDPDSPDSEVAAD